MARSVGDGHFQGRAHDAAFARVGPRLVEQRRRDAPSLLARAACRWCSRAVRPSRTSRPGSQRSASSRSPRCSGGSRCSSISSSRIRLVQGSGNWASSIASSSADVASLGQADGPRHVTRTFAGREVGDGVGFAQVERRHDLARRSRPRRARAPGVHRRHDLVEDRRPVAAPRTPLR